MMRVVVVLVTLTSSTRTFAAATFHVADALHADPCGANTRYAACADLRASVSLSCGRSAGRHSEQLTTVDTFFFFFPA